MDQGQQLNSVKTVVDGPLSLQVKKDYKRHVGKNERIFRFCATGLLLLMTLAAIYCNSDGTASSRATVVAVIGFTMGIVWAMMYAAIVNNKPKGKSEWDTFRINELYEEGAISTSPYSKTIIDWEDVLGFWETKDYIVLQGKQGEIVWQTEFLTSEATAVILNHLNTHVPKGTIHKLDTAYGKAANPYRIPEMPARQPLITQAGFSEKKRLTIWSRFSNVLMKAAAGFFIIAGDLTGIICSQFTFNNVVLDNPLLWFAGICLLSAGVIYLMCAVEQIGKKPWSGFIYFYPVGIVIADGKNQYFLGKEQVNIRKLQLEFRQKGLCINADQTYSTEAIENYKK